MNTGMISIIALHRMEVRFTPGYEFHCSCGEAITDHLAHLAEKLAKAGYGSVQEALLAAADEMPIETLRGSISKATVWLRQRAHSLDPEGRALVQAIHDRKAEG